jgi:hypothetical protein
MAGKLGLHHLAEGLNQYAKRADEAKMGYSGAHNSVPAGALRSVRGQSLEIEASALFVSRGRYAQTTADQGRL